MLSEASEIIPAVGGVGLGGGLVYIFVQGALKQMAAWKDLVVSHVQANESLTRANKTLTGENDQLHEIIQEHRDLLNKVRGELAICEAERKIQDERIAQLSLKILDIEAATRLLEERNTRSDVQHGLDHPS